MLVHFGELVPHSAPMVSTCPTCAPGRVPALPPRPWLGAAAGQGCEKTPRRGGEGSRGCPRAQPPVGPARRSRPAPSAPAGALTPIPLRKHLLSFKVTRPPFLRGETIYSITTAPFRLAGEKISQKQRALYRKKPQRQARRCLRAPRPSLPPLAEERAEISRPAARLPGETARNSRPRLRRARNHHLIIITAPIIATAMTTTAIAAVKVVIAVLKGRRVFSGQVTERHRRTGKPVPSRVSRSRASSPRGTERLPVRGTARLRRSPGRSL